MVGLRAFWPLMLSTGSVDVVRNIAATREGNAAFVPQTSLFQSGVILDGTGDDLFTAYAPVTASYPNTIAAWAIGGGTSQGVIAIDDSTALSDDGWRIVTADSVTLQMNARSGAISGTAISGAWTSDRWNLITAVFLSSAASYLFVNGVLAGSGAIGVTPAGSLSRTIIGALRPGGVAPWVGRITHVCVWDRALSDAEVWQLYDPRTRWDLYQVRSRRLYMDLASAPVGRLSRLALMGAG